MPISAPQSVSPIVGQNSIVSPDWSIFFTQVWKALTGKGGPLPLQSYAVSALPPASKNTAGLVYVPGHGPLYSNGTNWLTMTGTIVA